MEEEEVGRGGCRREKLGEDGIPTEAMVCEERERGIGGGCIVQEGGRQEGGGMLVV